VLGVVAETEQRYGALGLRLEGGTALAAYYLGHRQSEDLDIFGRADMDARDFGRALADAIEGLGMRLTRIGVANRGFAEYFVADHSVGGSAVRVQLLHASDYALAPANPTAEGLPVGSFRDVAAGKAHAVCDRYEPRDFIDLHAILYRPAVANAVPTREEVRERFRLLAADLTAIDPGLTPARFGAELAKAEGRQVVTEFPLRLLRAVSDEEVAATVELCLDEIAHTVRAALPGDAPGPRRP